jgi:hypothetical protein
MRSCVPLSAGRATPRMPQDRCWSHPLTQKERDTRPSRAPAPEWRASRASVRHPVRLTQWLASASTIRITSSPPPHPNPPPSPQWLPAALLAGYRAVQ